MTAYDMRISDWSSDVGFSDLSVGRWTWVVGVAAVVVAAVVTAAALSDSSEEATLASEGVGVVAEASTTTTAAVRGPDLMRIDIGPLLDPQHLDLPDEGLALRLGADTVVLLGLDGEVLGHLEGFALSPQPWTNPPSSGAGPLLLARADEALVLDGDRLVAVEGGPGALPLAGGAVLEPALLRLADGTTVPLPHGEISVSSDRTWVTVREPNAEGDGYGTATGYWLPAGTTVSFDDG